jgi:hypothetical protein
LFFFSRGDGFVPMAWYDGLSGLALLVTYLRVAKHAPSRSTVNV